MIVVLGIMGQTPFAGVGWQVLHYLEGLRRLGHDVYYVEDTGEWPFDPEQNMVTADCRYTADYIARLMGWCSLEDHWAYRAVSEGGRVYGLGEPQLRHLFARADALVNVTGATVLRDEHLRVPVRLYVETDPFQNQVEVAQGRKVTIDRLAAHTHHFTFGENVGTGACDMPIVQFNYRATRQPVVLDWWSPPADLPRGNGNLRFTTVASWRQTGKDVEWNGRVYAWSKHEQFLRFIELPRRTRVNLELALAGADADALATVRAHGWQVSDAVALSRDILSYRGYLQGSDAELTVAKDQYIVPRTGWFSDRSACYLAAGKPVVTQDTGFGHVIPCGRGLFGFASMGDALDAIDAIAGDYAKHAKAARDLATEYFSAEKVLARLLGEAGL